jgi:hypothetical protein
MAARRAARVLLNVSDKPILDRLRLLAETNPRLQQFGQSNDNLVHNGSTACTHTVCQFLSLAWNGTIPSLNEVNKLAGMPNNATDAKGRPRGMRPNELATYLKNAKIPMKIVRGFSFNSLLDHSLDGPVFYGMRYGSAPSRTKAHPNGTTQRGKHVSDMRHAVVMLGFLRFPATGGQPARTEVYRKEPNHGSPLRPERPPYDTLSDRQARIEYEAYHDLLGEPLYAAVPLRSMQVIGRLAAPAPAQPPPLVLTSLEAFSGVATIRGDGHFAVQLADREFIALPNGAQKRVVATGRLAPRLPGPAGDRTNVVLVGDEAAILLRADITLTTDGGVVVPPPATEADEDPPPGPPIVVPDGDPDPDHDEAASGPFPPD